MTPIGIPIVVDIFFGFGARAKVFFGIQGTSVQVGAGTGFFISVGARGSFKIPYVLEIGIGATLESNLNANAVVSAGFDTKFYTKMSLDLDIRPLTI
jgi:hypothetical protein